MAYQQNLPRLHFCTILPIKIPNVPLSLGLVGHCPKKFIQPGNPKFSINISRLAVNIIKLAGYYCHPGVCKTTQKLAHFFMALLITPKHKKEVEKFVKKVYGEKHSFSLIDIM